MRSKTIQEIAAAYPLEIDSRNVSESIEFNFSARVKGVVIVRLTLNNIGRDSEGALLLNGQEVFTFWPLDHATRAALTEPVQRVEFTVNQTSLVDGINTFTFSHTSGEGITVTAVALRYELAAQQVPKDDEIQALQEVATELVRTRDGVDAETARATVDALVDDVINRVTRLKPIDDE